MKRISFLSVLVLMLASFSVGAIAQEAETYAVQKSDKGIEVSGVVRMTATVQAINVNEREVVLANDAGDVRVIEAGPEVKNFDQIDVGDKVIIEYYESVALHLGNPEDKPEEAEAQVMLTATKGEKPGMVVVDVFDAIAEVVSIDKENRKVELKGPEGKIATIKVEPEIGDLEKIKVGDKLRVRYTEAVAVSVQSPE
jgi:hypothetical protein